MMIFKDFKGGGGYVTDDFIQFRVLWFGQSGQYKSSLGQFGFARY